MDNILGNLCKITSGIVLVLSIIGGFVSGNVLFACIGGFLFSLILFAIGEIVTQISIANDNIYDLFMMIKKNLPTETSKKSKPPTAKLSNSKPISSEPLSASNSSWTCKKCDAQNNMWTSFCKDCGEGK